MQHLLRVVRTDFCVWLIKFVATPKPWQSLSTVFSLYNGGTWNVLRSFACVYFSCNLKGVFFIFSAYLGKNEPRCVCARVIVCRCVLVWCMGVCSMLALRECDVRRLDAIKTWVNNSIASLCWQLLQQDIESHSRIVSAVLKLSERLENDRLTCSCDTDKESLQLVALNLQKRWHGIWLQSLEWQCRLEEAINRRKVRMNYGSVALNGFCCTSKGHPFRQMSSTVQT